MKESTKTYFFSRTNQQTDDLKNPYSCSKQQQQQQQPATALTTIGHISRFPEIVQNQLFLARFTLTSFFTELKKEERRLTSAWSLLTFVIIDLMKKYFYVRLSKIWSTLRVQTKKKKKLCPNFPRNWK